MRIPEQYEALEALERYLGDPMEPDVPFSFRRVVDLDEREEYPQELIDLLSAWGVARFHVPPKYGGGLASLEQLLILARLLARRDLTVAIANGVSFLGSMPVWLAGSEAQRQRAAALLLANQKLGFAVTEKDHGHDIVNNDLTAEPETDGYRLSGQKWTWGNATRSVAFTLHARTDQRHGPRSHSMFFIEKAQLDPSTYENTPKVKSMGLKGHDLSGIQFHGTPLPAECLIGREGLGVELATKSLLLTRTMCGGLSMGSGDTALRTTMAFALNRQLFGDTVWAIEHAKSVLVEAFLDLLISDCLTTSTARAWHVLTDQMSIWSAAVKYLVPVTMEAMVKNVSVVLGARFFLREAHCDGIFQKLFRDTQIISVFEGNTTTQLFGIAIQLRHLMRPKANLDRAQLAADLEQVFSLHQPLPEFYDTAQVDLHAHGVDHALRGLDLALERLEGLKGSPKVAPETLAEIADQAEALVTQVQELADLVASHKPTSDKSPEVLEMARRYAVLHTAACCLHTWLYNHDHLDEFFVGGEWLVLGLDKLLYDQRPSRGFIKPIYMAKLAERLLQLHQENRLFGIVPMQLGQPALISQ